MLYRFTFIVIESFEIVKQAHDILKSRMDKSGSLLNFCQLSVWMYMKDHNKMYRLVYIHGVWT